MFVDASAIVAMVTGEADADALADILQSATSAITSPIAIFEAIAGIARKRHASVEEARDDVHVFASLAQISTVPISDRDTEIAVAAYARYGKGRGHPAQLNMGDCFAYAVARNYRVPLLFKGDDFAKTDIVVARVV